MVTLKVDPDGFFLYWIGGSNLVRTTLSQTGLSQRWSNGLLRFKLSTKTHTIKYKWLFNVPAYSKC